MKISDSTSISMPMRNLISILGAVAIGVWGYFGLVERLTLLEMQNASLMKDLEHAEDRLTADIDQFMLIEDLYKSFERMQSHLDAMANNKINIEFLNEQMDKAVINIEKLKDADRDIKYTNGNGAEH
jgi:hypothetical protein